MARNLTFPARSSAILNPESYPAPVEPTTEVDLGLLGSATVAGISYQTTIRSNVRLGGQMTGVDLTGINLMLTLHILDHSEDLMGLVFQESGSGFEYFQDYTLGHPIEITNPEMLKSILIRPTDPTKPHLYIPKGFVHSVGPFIWDRRQMVYDSTILTISAIWDPVRVAAFYYGDPSDWSAL